MQATSLECGQWDGDQRAHALPAEPAVALFHSLKLSVWLSACVCVSLAGKTTLVDCLLRSAVASRMDASSSRVMDSNTIEKERGITILSKCQ